MKVKDQSEARRKLAVAARRTALALPCALPPVFFLTDTERVTDPVAIARNLPCGWGVIFRHRHMHSAGDLARDLAAACRSRNLVLLVAHDPALALELGADGVHWPERCADESRRWAGRFDTMTASAHSRAGLARLAGLPIDAALRSVVFPSQSASAGKAMGALRFRAEARRTRLPVYGLGGIDAANAGRIAISGGLAAIDGLARAFGD